MGVVHLAKISTGAFDIMAENLAKLTTVEHTLQTLKWCLRFIFSASLGVFEYTWVHLSKFKLGKWYNWAKLERHFDTTCDNCLFRRAWHIDRCLHLQHSTSIVSLLEENWLFENQNLFFIFWSAVYSFIVFSYFPTSLNLWSPSKRSVLRGPSIHPIPCTSSKRRASTVVIFTHTVDASEIWQKKKNTLSSW